MKTLSNIKMRKFISIIFLLSIVVAIFSPSISLADGFFKDFDVKIDNHGEIALTDPAAGSGFGGILEKYKGFIIGIGGLSAVTMVGIFIFHLVSLGKSAGNPQARTQALTGLMWTGVATAGLGAVALITALFYGSLKD